MAELNDLIQVLNSPAYFFDLQSHRLLAVNRHFAELMEYDENAMLEMTVDELRSPEDAPMLRKVFSKLPPEGFVEWRYKTHGGKIVPARISYRSSIYIDRKTGRHHNVRMVVVSSESNPGVESAQEVFESLLQT